MTYSVSGSYLFSSFVFIYYQSTSRVKKFFAKDKLVFLPRKRPGIELTTQLQLVPKLENMYLYLKLGCLHPVACTRSGSGVSV
jgi:hypothetical protein